jgi:hypothetical protein
MAIEFKRAERQKSKLRLGISGPAGSGKSFSSILMALGIGGRIAMIDTERGSGDLYCHLGEYDTCTLEPPFTPEKYVEAIKAAEVGGYDIIIIDSLSHAWAGPGGVLDIHGHSSDKNGNSWTAWRQVTPRHNDLVDAMLQSRCHIIATMRSKMEHIQTTENGKTVIKKVGMNPIQRDGMEYEFTVFLDLDHNHFASTSKDRTSLFDGQVFKPNQETGSTLAAWLEKGTAPVPTTSGQATVTAINKPQTKPPPSEPVTINDYVATQLQIKKIHTMVNQLQYQDGLKLLLQRLGKQSVKELTKQEASVIIDTLSELVNCTPVVTKPNTNNKKAKLSNFQNECDKHFWQTVEQQAANGDIPSSNRQRLF